MFDVFEFGRCVIAVTCEQVKSAEQTLPRPVLCSSMCEGGPFARAPVASCGSGGLSAAGLCGPGPQLDFKKS